MAANNDPSTILWVYINRDVPFIGGIGQVSDVRSQARIAELETIRDAYDVETAVGAQLDVLGAQVYEPRLGRTDDQYRIAIRVQALVLASNGSSGVSSDVSGPPGLTQIWAAVTSSRPTTYFEIYPHYVSIGGAVANEFEEDLIRSSITEAAPGGRRFVLLNTGVDALIPEYGPNPGVGNGEPEYGPDPIPVTAVTAYRI